MSRPIQQPQSVVSAPSAQVAAAVQLPSIGQSSGIAPSLQLSAISAHLQVIGEFMRLSNPSTQAQAVQNVRARSVEVQEIPSAEPQASRSLIPPRRTIGDTLRSAMVSIRNRIHPEASPLSSPISPPLSEVQIISQSLASRIANMESYVPRVEHEWRDYEADQAEVTRSHIQSNNSLIEVARRIPNPSAELTSRIQRLEALNTRLEVPSIVQNQSEIEPEDLSQRIRFAEPASLEGSVQSSEVTSSASLISQDEESLPLDRPREAVSAALGLARMNFSGLTLEQRQAAIVNCNRAMEIARDAARSDPSLARDIQALRAFLAPGSSPRISSGGSWRHGSAMQLFHALNLSIQSPDEAPPVPPLEPLEQRSAREIYEIMTLQINLTSAMRETLSHYDGQEGRPAELSAELAEEMRAHIESNQALIAEARTYESPSDSSQPTHSSMLASQIPILENLINGLLSQRALQNAPRSAQVVLGDLSAQIEICTPIAELMSQYGQAGHPAAPSHEVALGVQTQFNSNASLIAEARRIASPSVELTGEIQRLEALNGRLRLDPSPCDSLGFCPSCARYNGYLAQVPPLNDFMQSVDPNNEVQLENLSIHEGEISLGRDAESLADSIRHNIEVGGIFNRAIAGYESRGVSIPERVEDWMREYISSNPSLIEEARAHSEGSSSLLTGLVSQLQRVHQLVQAGIDRLGIDSESAVDAD